MTMHAIEPSARNVGIPDDDTLPEEVRVLVQRAFDRYGARCLWNIPHPKDLRGVEAVSSALRRNGGMTAWWLAVELEEAAGCALG